MPHAPGHSRQQFGANSPASDASASEKIAMQGSTMRLGPNRSRRIPNAGEAPATVSAAMVKPAEIASRCHPNESESGLMKRPKV